MRYVPRELGDRVQKAARGFPAIILTGPRRAGKTTLLRHLYPQASYALLEDPAVTAAVRADPHGFLADLRLPVVLDEIQNTPELFNYVRAMIDAAPSRMGRWLFTGSQEAGLMQGVTESMAGRAALFQLLPLSTRESTKVTPFRGGFPEAIARPRLAPVWFQSYLQTYLERDVRAVSSIRELATFRRFMALLAARCGQLLNKTELAGPLGVSVPAITEWLNILEITGQILVVPPFYENFGKRLVKSPRVYFTDSGLACHLLGIESERAWQRSPFTGAIWEGFVAAEIVKQQLNAGRRRELYYFRDQQGLEVDFVVPLGNAHLALVECKAARTAFPADAAPLARLMQTKSAYRCQAFVVHRPTSAMQGVTALIPGVRAVDLPGLLRALDR